MFKNCNGTIKEASEGESSNMESVEDDEELLDEFDHEKPIGIFIRNQDQLDQKYWLFFWRNLVQNNMYLDSTKVTLWQVLFTVN